MRANLVAFAWGFVGMAAAWLCYTGYQDHYRINDVVGYLNQQPWNTRPAPQAQPVPTPTVKAK